MTEDDIISGILKDEGWPIYTDDPRDSGGPTKGGITITTLSIYRHTLVTAADVESLTEAEVRDIYAQRYITGPGFNLIADAGLRAHAIDCAVLHGTDRTARWLQEIAAVTVDGKFGPLSQAMLNGVHPQKAGSMLAARRIRFMGEILGERHDQVVFAKGWLNRATRFLDALAVSFKGAA